MAWTDPAGHVWVTGEVVTAASMNAYVRLNLEDQYRQRGTVALSFSAAVFVNVTVTFPVAFAATPVIQVTPECSSVAVIAAVLSRTATQMTVQVSSRDNAAFSASAVLHWVAHRA